MLTKNINFTNYRYKKNNKVVEFLLKKILKLNNEVIKSLDVSYRDNYNSKIFKIFKKKLDYRLIGMGGSILGAQAIYGFLKNKIKNRFYFITISIAIIKNSKKSFNNLIISKSGNTIETIINSNILIKKDDKNLFITENKQSYLRKLANKLRSEVVDHNNYIGGRYSVLSEVGMLPAELMGLKPKKFRTIKQSY